MRERRGKKPYRMKEVHVRRRRMRKRKGKKTKDERRASKKA